MANLLPQAEPTVDASGRKIWKAGTLTYTTGGLVILCALLLWGDFAVSVKERAIAPVFQVMLVKFHASDLVFTLIGTALATTINIFLAPLLGYLSDRFRSPWGRRIPVLTVATPFISLGMVGVGFAPMMGTQLHTMLGPHAPALDTCILGTIAFFWALYDMVNIVTFGIFQALINDVVPRPVLGRFFGLWRAVSLICAMIFNHYFLGYSKTHYLEIFLCTALVFGLGYALMCLFVKEGDYPPPPPAPPHGALTFFYSAKDYLVECFSIPYYWLYFATIICGTLAAVPINTFTIPFNDAIGATMQQYGDYQTFSYFISLMLAYPLGFLVDKTHPLPLGLGAMFLYFLAVLWGGIYAVDQRMYGIALVAHIIMSGTFFTVTASLAQRLLPKASFAQFVAAGGIVQSVIMIAVTTSIGGFLDYVHHVYRYTYYMSAFFAALGCILYVALYIQFLKRGGPKGYVAPDRHVA